MPEKELRRLQSVHRFLKLDLKVREELQKIIQQLIVLCDVPVAMITLMDDKSQFIQCSIGTDLEEVPLEQTFCQHAIVQYEFLQIEDTRIDSRTASNPFVVYPPFVRFYAGMPLTTDEGLNVGTICIFDTQPRKLDDAESKMIKAMARQVINLMEFEASLLLLKKQYVLSRQNSITMRSYFESSASCHLLLDKEMKILAFNKAIIDITYSHQHIYLREGDHILQLVDSSFRDEFITCFNAALKGKTSRTDIDVAYSLGRIHWYINFSPATDANGEVIGVSFNAIDITEDTIQQEQVRERERSLREIARIQFQEIYSAGNLVVNFMNCFLQEEHNLQREEFLLLAEAVEELKLFLNSK